MSDAKFELRMTEGESDCRLFEIATGNEIEGLRSWERSFETVTASSAYGGTVEHDIPSTWHLEGRMRNGIEWHLDLYELKVVMVPSPSD